MKLSLLLVSPFILAFPADPPPVINPVVAAEPVLVNEAHEVAPLHAQPEGGVAHEPLAAAAPIHQVPAPLDHDQAAHDRIPNLIAYLNELNQQELDHDIETPPTMSPAKVPPPINRPGLDLVRNDLANPAASMALPILNLEENQEAAVNHILAEGVAPQNQGQAVNQLHQEHDFHTPPTMSPAKVPPPINRINRIGEPGVPVAPIPFQLPAANIMAEEVAENLAHVVHPH